MLHQCYYCEQIFDTKEQLYDHLEIHANIKDIDRKTSKNNSKNPFLGLF